MRNSPWHTNTCNITLGTRLKRVKNNYERRLPEKPHLSRRAPQRQGKLEDVRARDAADDESKPLIVSRKSI
jgi:hypothetical protein